MIKLIAMTLIILTICSAGAFASYSVAKYVTEKNVIINSFDSCVSAGYLVMESTPLRCMDSEGNVFVNKLS